MGRLNSVVVIDYGGNKIDPVLNIVGGVGANSAGTTGLVGQGSTWRGTEGHHERHAMVERPANKCVIKVPLVRALGDFNISPR